MTGVREHTGRRQRAGGALYLLGHISHLTIERESESRMGAVGLPGRGSRL